MATLLLRAGGGGGLSNTQKVPLSSLTYTKAEDNMIEEEQNNQQQQQRGSRSSRKSKNGQKKIPQRGLGVAQLEKLRMEEQQKQEAACLASLQRAQGHLFPPLSSSFHSHDFPHSTKYATQIKMKALQHPFMLHRNGCETADSLIPMMNYRASAVGLKQQIGMNCSKQSRGAEESGGSWVHFSRRSTTNTECLESCVPPLPLHMWPLHGHGEDLNRTFNYELENRKVDALGGLRPHNSSNHLCDSRLFNCVLRNSSTPAIKPPASSDTPTQTPLEPPSNQSHSSNPFWSDGDKIAGVKRSWPLFRENPLQSKNLCLNTSNVMNAKSEESTPAAITDDLGTAKQDATAAFRSLEPLKKKKTAWQMSSEFLSPRNSPQLCCEVPTESTTRSRSVKEYNTEVCEIDTFSRNNEKPNSFLTLGFPSTHAVLDQIAKQNTDQKKSFATFSEISNGSSFSQKLSAFKQEAGRVVTIDATLKSNEVMDSEQNENNEGWEQTPFYKFLSDSAASSAGMSLSSDSNFKSTSSSVKAVIDLDLKLSL